MSAKRATNDLPPEQSRARPRNNRSKVTNGVRLLPEGDQRSTWARRFRDVWAMLVDDLGGPDAVSEAERSIARRAALITVECEQMEVAFAEAHGSDPAALLRYGTMSNTLRRLHESLGMKRRPRTVTIGDYLSAGSRR